MLPATAHIPIRWNQQDTVQWCWAACALMIDDWLGGDPQLRECDLATLVTGVPGCCAIPTPPACIQPANDRQVSAVFDWLGIGRVGPDLPLTMQTLFTELALGRPVEIGFGWANGGGHVAIAHGYDALGMIEVADPWFGQRRVLYSELACAYGIGRWRESYGRFRRVSQGQRPRI